MSAPRLDRLLCSNRGFAGTLSLALFLGGVLAQAQTVADLSFQSYITNLNGQSGRASAGLALSFRDFLPGVGLLSGNLAGGSSEGSGLPGRNYLKLEGAQWLNRRVDVTVGDFEMPSSPIENYVPGISLPDFMATGISAFVRDGNHDYGVFAGEGYLLQGPRISFRIPTGQKIVGASGKWRLGPQFMVGARLTNLFLDRAGSDKSLSGLVDPVSRSFRESSNLTLQARWLARENLEVFGETALTHSEKSSIAGNVPLRPLSFEGGVNWKGTTQTARVVFLDQAADYLPLAGFYLGGRKGAIADYRIHPFASVDLFAGGAHLETATALTSAVSKQSTTSYSAGASMTLPGKVSLTSSYSSIDVFAISVSGKRTKSVTNSVATVGLARPFGRQTYRLSFTDLDVTTLGGQQKQRSTDFEDDVRFRWGSLGGTLRWQNQFAATLSNNLAFRAYCNLTFRRFNVFGSVEKGSDLVSRSLFTRSALSTSSLGVRGKLGRQVELYVDAFRTRLLLNINPESAFALANQGTLPSFLFLNDHWTLYSRVTKHFSWKGGDSSGDLASYTAKQLPITGSIEGIVSVVHGTEARTAAPGVPVMVDHDRTEYTDSSGHFRFTGIPEGHHTVELDTRGLPVEYDVQGSPANVAEVKPSRLSRLDFEVCRLGQLEGTVRTDTGKPLALVPVRLEPGGFSTTTGMDGKFLFENLKEGDYTVSSHGTQLVARVAEVGQQAVAFSITEETKQKPVRKITLELQSQP